MADSYDSFVELAVRLIAAKGAALEVRQVIEETALDATQPWKLPEHDPTDDIVESGLRAVLIQLDKQMMDSADMVRGDMFLLVAPYAGTPQPQIGLRCLLGDSPTQEEWYVITAIPVNPGGVVVLWKLHVRRWPSRSSAAPT